MLDRLPSELLALVAGHLDDDRGHELRPRWVCERDRAALMATCRALRGVLGRATTRDRSARHEGGRGFELRMIAMRDACNIPYRRAAEHYMLSRAQMLALPCSMDLGRKLYRARDLVEAATASWGTPERFDHERKRRWSEHEACARDREKRRKRWAEQNEHARALVELEREAIAKERAAFRCRHAEEVERKRVARHRDVPAIAAAEGYPLLPEQLAMLDETVFVWSCGDQPAQEQFERLREIRFDEEFKVRAVRACLAELQDVSPAASLQLPTHGGMREVADARGLGVQMSIARCLRAYGGYLTMVPLRHRQHVDAAVCNFPPHRPIEVTIRLP